MDNKINKNFIFVNKRNKKETKNINVKVITAKACKILKIVEF